MKLTDLAALPATTEGLLLANVLNVDSVDDFVRVQFDERVHAWLLATRQDSADLQENLETTLHLQYSQWRRPAE